MPGLEIIAYVSQVHDLVAPTKLADITFKEIEGNIVRWPDSADAERVIALIEKVRSEGDSVGGVVTCVVRGREMVLRRARAAQALVGKK